MKDVVLPASKWSFWGDTRASFLSSCFRLDLMVCNCYFWSIFLARFWLLLDILNAPESSLILKSIVLFKNFLWLLRPVFVELFWDGMFYSCVLLWVLYL